MTSKIQQRNLNCSHREWFPDYPLLVWPLFIGIMFLCSYHSHAIVLNGHGQIISWGFMQSSYASTSDTFTNIAAQYDHSLAIKTDGTVVGWGRSDSGEALAPLNSTN